MIDTYRGLKTVSHTGWHGGFKTVLLRFPEQRFSVIILANIRDFVPLRMGKKVADLYLQDQMTPMKEPPIVKVADADLDGFKGEYRFGYSLWRVAFSRQGDLFVQADGGEKKRLFASAQNEFFDREDGLTYRFVKKKDDLLLETSIEKVTNTGKRLRLVEPAPEKLAELIGVYRSGELDVKTTLEVRDGKLVLRSQKSDATLQFLDNGDCIARPTEAYYSIFVVRFTRSDGVVTGYTLSTERVRNMRYAKVKTE
jgi:hypothetical protein